MHWFRWLQPMSNGPLDRVTYRLRLVLAIQIAIFGLITYLVLYFGTRTSAWLALPDLISHIMLGLFLWTNIITWSTMLAVALVGVLGMALGNAATLEIFFVFFIIPLVLPFYSSTRVALTTQILIWVMVGGTGIGLAITAPDRLPWTAMVIEACAVGLVGTLMVIFRFSLLRLIGANQRLENILSQYQLLYADFNRATLVFGRSGHIRAVYGSSETLLNMKPERLVGLHHSKLPINIKGPNGLWQSQLQGELKKKVYEGTSPSINGDDNRIKVRFTPAKARQRSAGVTLIVDLQNLGSIVSQ